MLRRPVFRLPIVTTICLMALVATAVAVPGADEPNAPNQPGQAAIESGADYTTLQSQLKTAACDVRATVETYIRTVKTVASVLIGAAKTVIAAILKIAVGFLVAMVIAIGQWLLSLFF